MIATPFDLNEFHSLDVNDRVMLAELARRRFQYSDHRRIPDAFRSLIAKGLAFHAHGRISITNKGLEVAERVG